MGKMKAPASSKKATENRPEPKSKNRKSVGPSLKDSPGTLKTKAGSKKGLKDTKSGTSATPKAAGEKKGTVHRSSKESRGEKKLNVKITAESARRERSSTPTKDTASKKITRTDKSPAAKAHGKNARTSSSRPVGQP